MGTIINSASFVKQFNHPSATQQGLITGLYDVGCLVGSILAVLFGERLGRKRSIYIGALIVIIGTILQTVAQVVVHLIVARVFTGVGVGIMTAVVPTWQAEVSQAHNRGAMITIEAVNIIVGFALSNWVSFGASYATSNLQWILPIALQVVFALYLLAIGPFLVESPRWLAHHQDIDQATRVLARLLDTTEDDARVQESRAEILEALRLETGGSFREIFTGGGQQNFRRMMLGVGALYFQQMSGINTVGYYLPVILEDQVGMTNRMAQIVAGCGALFYLFASLPPIWFIDRVGRRPAMMCGAAALTLVNILLCVGFNIPGTSGTILIVVMYFLYYAAFALSFLNVSWIYPPEINSLKMRSSGASLASCSNWLCKYRYSYTYCRVHKHLLTTPSQRHLRDHHSDRARQHRLEVLPHVGRLQLLLHPHGLLPLPRDQGPPSRADRPHLRGPQRGPRLPDPGRPREHQELASRRRHRERERERPRRGEGCLDHLAELREQGRRFWHCHEHRGCPGRAEIVSTVPKM